MPSTISAEPGTETQLSTEDWWRTLLSNRENLQDTQRRAIFFFFLNIVSEEIPPAWTEWDRDKKKWGGGGGLLYSLNSTSKKQTDKTTQPQIYTTLQEKSRMTTRMKALIQRGEHKATKHYS